MASFPARPFQLSLRESSPEQKTFKSRGIFLPKVQKKYQNPCVLFRLPCTEIGDHLITVTVIAGKAETGQSVQAVVNSLNISTSTWKAVSSSHRYEREQIKALEGTVTRGT